MRVSQNSLVVLHDVDHGDITRIGQIFRPIMLERGITSILSFTDLGDTVNPRDARIEEAAESAGLFVVQSALLHPPTRDVMWATAPLMFGEDGLQPAGHGIRFGIFDDLYRADAMGLQEFVDRAGFPSPAAVFGANDTTRRF